MKLELFYPVRPHKVNQVWGGYSDIYKQFGFSRHNGEDLNLVNGQKISAPFDCEVIRTGTVENGKWQPKGGGIFVGLLSKNTYDFDDGKQAKVLVDFLHCKEILVQEGQTVSVGDVIALGDNTGFSTGPHTHFQCRRVVWDGRTLLNVDVNDANGSFDPAPYWVKIYADSWFLMRVIKEKINKLKGLINK